MLAHREPAPALVQDVTASMVSRGGGHLSSWGRWTPRPRSVCSLDRFPELDPDAAEEIAQTGGGLPFPMIEMARARVSGSGSVSAMLPPEALRTFQRVALLGLSFSTDELLAVSDVLRGRDLRPAGAGRWPPWWSSPPRAASASGTLSSGRDWCEQLAAAPAVRGHQRVAEALARWSVPRAGSPTTTSRPDSPRGRCRTSVQAVEIAGALGAYRDALALVDGVREHAGPEHLPVLLARRGDLLMALGDPGAVEAYAEAARVTTGTLHRLVRARLARAAAVGGDLATARSALAGLELRGRRGRCVPAPGAGHGGLLQPATWRPRGGSRPRPANDCVGSTTRGTWSTWSGCTGLLAHHRGEWFASFRTELRRTQGHERLAGALFDAHLCVAENLLYGREPYPEIIAEAEQLRLRARQAGALRGVAFATALIGEAALMMGDVDPRGGGARGGRRAPRRHRRGRRPGPQHAAAGRGAPGPGPQRRGQSSCSTRRSCWRAGPPWACTCCNASSGR